MSCKLDILLGLLFVALAIHATAQTMDAARPASVRNIPIGCIGSSPIEVHRLP